VESYVGHIESVQLAAITKVHNIESRMEGVMEQGKLFTCFC